MSEFGAAGSYLFSRQFRGELSSLYQQGLRHQGRPFIVLRFSYVYHVSAGCVCILVVRMVHARGPCKGQFSIC